MTGHTAHFDVAESIAQCVFDLPDAVPIYLHAAQIGMALIAVQWRDETAGGELYNALLPVAGTMSPQSNIGPGLAVDRLLGLLSQTMGNLDQATAHFEDALAFCRKAGFRPELAWACYEYAGLLIQRIAEGDRAKAMALIDESLAISGELGMRLLARRVGALQEKAEAQPVRAPAYPDGLTAREVEVLLLICGGRTDREIGEDLFISVNTVGNHVRSILNKAHAANRAEAATYAALHGIFTTPGTV